MTDSLTDFLLARIESRERVARRRLADWEERGVTERVMRLSPDSPRFMLAECEAKRRIVNRLATADEEPRAMAEFGRILSLLALPYADHPDYREEWKP